MAKLYRVTITGADDQVDPGDLLKLSEEFPFVEWAFLRSLDRNGTPRYPSDSWIEKWKESRGGASVHWAMHLCGKLARYALAGYPPLGRALRRLDGKPRVQLNGFSAYRIPMLSYAETNCGTEFILQCSGEEAAQHVADLRAQHENLVPIWDASGGRGWPMGNLEEWQSRWSHIGYAGGLGPDNVARIAYALTLGPVQQRFWIDMESGVRTDDRFDLTKVRAVVEGCAPLVDVE